MKIDFSIIIATVLNFFLLSVIIVSIYKLINNFRNIRLRNREMSEKIEFIFNKLKD